MESENEKKDIPVGLEKDLRIWLDILQLWRSHLGFLKIRLSALNRRNPGKLNHQQFDNLAMGLQFYSDSVLADYQEALRTDLEVREKQPQSLEGLNWLEEHDMFDRHMKQLRTEYHKLLSETVEAVNKLENNQADRSE